MQPGNGECVRNPTVRVNDMARHGTVVDARYRITWCRTEQEQCMRLAIIKFMVIV